MAENLIFLPEAYPVARLLCDYLFTGAMVGGGIDLLILKKQRPAFEPLIKGYPFKALFVLDEEYYGSVTKRETEQFVKGCLEKRYAQAFFPFNTFKGNAFLFGAVLAMRVSAVNSSLFGIKDVPVIEFALDTVVEDAACEPCSEKVELVKSAKEEAAKCLSDVVGKTAVSGERPSFGLVDGFAHDIELFCNYAVGAKYATGKRVLDIGGGLGYGTYLLSKFASEVVYVDKSRDVVETIEKLWMPLAPNITALCADVTELVLDACSYDTIFLMEMLEHIEQPEELLRRIIPLLKDGGTMVITTPEEDLFPYRVCPKESWPGLTGASTDELLDRAIWPWHIQPLGEWALLPMLERVGLKIRSKSYLTYSRGAELARKLSKAVESGDTCSIFKLLNNATVWSVDDFSVTDKRDAVFSAFFYNVAVTKK